MNIIVCIKQVPATNEVKMNKETNTIIREGVESIINPYDIFAVEEALKIRDHLGGKVTVLSMGIPSTSDILRETIALGADDSVLLSDRAFAGADSLATSYALSKGIEKIGAFDLVICGKQATDGDTAQVGPSLAEKLGIPHTTYVKKIEEITPTHITCHCATEDGFEIVELPLPALITVVKDINEPRLPSIKDLIRSRDYKPDVFTAEDVGADVNKCGLKGSPTQVVKTFVPEHQINTEFLEGTASEQASKLVELLISKEGLEL